MAFLSTRRVCRSAFTACLRSFFSSLDSFFGRVRVTRWAVKEINLHKYVEVQNNAYDDRYHRRQTMMLMNLALEEDWR